ncbi:MAG: YeeE/YedE family protein [Burkholderiales bacterium]|nr:YeeE/YedE family protein [Burkholderiales bacterium]
MELDVAHFSPITALAGGIFVGVAATGFAWVLGRVMGVSGIIGGLLSASPGDRAWRWAFLIGLAAAPWVWIALVGHPYVDVEAGHGRLLVAGVLVGIGSRMGSGCTSGHGVCGMTRFSVRSLAATGVFMATAMATVYLSRLVSGS